MKIKKLMVLTLTSGVCAWAAWEGYKFLARELAQAAESRSKRRVVVMGFYSETGAKSRASAIVTERLTSEIAANPRMEVIERNRLDEVLREQNLTARGVVDPATARRIGNILGADAVVTGSVIELTDQKVEVNARLVDTQDARIIKAVTKTVEKDWEDKKVDWQDFDFNVNVNLDAPVALLPEGFMEDDSCRKLSAAEADLVHEALELRARKTAWDLKTGVLKPGQMTKNPGSEIKDQALKHLFYSKIKEWYYSEGLQPLTPHEEDILQSNSPMIEKYPCL
jgi:TolB-like protein